MMFRWTIKQPGIQKFWNLCGLYQDIYDCISPLNKLSGRPFILTQQSMGRNKYGISGHLQYFRFFEALNGAFELPFFQGFIFTPYQRHREHVGTCSSDLKKVKSLLNDAFNRLDCSISFWILYMHLFLLMKENCIPNHDTLTRWRRFDVAITHISHWPSPSILYELKFSRWFYFREFRESNPRENFHFNLCLFIVMTTSAKSRN